MKDFKEAAIQHAKLIYPDQHNRQIVAAADFDIGAQHGYSEAKKEVREFYLLVSEFMNDPDMSKKFDQGDRIRMAINHFKEQDKV